MALNPLAHPGVHGTAILDVEKQQTETTIGTASEAQDVAPSALVRTLRRWNDRVEGLAGLEARGIARVLPEEKHSAGTAGYVQMFALWFGMNLSVIFVVSGLLGPLVFQLGWIDCVCIVIFANVPGCAAGAYTSTFGPGSGHRAMVLSRFFVGYWPAKLACLLNIIMQTGWGFIACIIAGQVIAAVNGHGLSIGVGCAISALCIGVLCVFGIAILHVFERYAWYPQAFAFLVLIGSSGRNWNTSLDTIGDEATVAANRCSFFALIFASVVGFSAVSSDFYVYYPTSTSKKLTFALTWSGTWTATMASELIGVGIATGVTVNPAWSEAYNISSGALLVACFKGLGSFGGFCGVLIALGAIQNVAPTTYVAALSIQTLGRYVRTIPRWVLCLFIMSIELACSVAGRNSLYGIFENFLPIMAYWVCPWLTIVIEEHVLFHVLRGVPFDWTIWEQPKKLPFGAAAMLAWLVGWAGAIIGMAQVYVTNLFPVSERTHRSKPAWALRHLKTSTWLEILLTLTLLCRWYTGPVAIKIGGHGGDVGGWLSIAFAGLAYPPLRLVELRITGR